MNVDRALLIRVTILEHTASSQVQSAKRRSARRANVASERANPRERIARNPRDERSRPIPTRVSLPCNLPDRYKLSHDPTANIFPTHKAAISVLPRADPSARSSTRAGFTSTRRDDRDLSGAKSNGINGGVDAANSMVIRGSLIMRADPPRLLLIEDERGQTEQERSRKNRRASLILFPPFFGSVLKISALSI